MQLPKTGDKILGKYVLENALGEGGMGVVYAARHDLLGQRVAVKLIRPEYASREDAVARFLNEARAASLIQNEHVARVLDVGTLEDGLPYMVLEYLAGHDLSRILIDRGPLPVSDVADYLLEAIDAVAHAHSLGIVHRDLKPSNLFLTRRQDATVQVKVFDFGISKFMNTTGGSGASMTHTNAMLGSPLYMSPEQLRDSKNVDHRCDIWALGVVAYELLTGRTPFLAENAVALFAAIQESEPQSLCAQRADVSPALEGIIMRCLRRRVDERWESVTELAYALAPYGSQIASRALENAARILPLKHPVPLRASNAAFPVNGPVITGASGPAPGSNPPPGQSGRAITALAVSTANTGAPPAPRAGFVVALVSLVLVALTVVGSVVFIARSRASQAQATADANTASPATALPSGEPSATSSLAFLPLEPPVPSGQPSASAAPPGVTPPASPPPVVVARPLAPPVAIAVTTKPPTQPSSAPSGARPNCNPPYEFDASGRKIWKRECL